MAGPKRVGENRRGFAAAVGASAALHAVVAVVLALVWALSNPPVPPPGALIDTRAEGDTHIELTFQDLVFEPPAAPPPAPSSSAPPPPATRRPEVVPVPSVLPKDMLAVLRRPDPPLAAVVEVPFTPPPSRPADPDVRPAFVAVDPPVADPTQLVGGASGTAPAPPLHGALSPNQTIVYVLDASGSMGRAGKFARAREALVATLRAQSSGVRFQVVVYSGTARALLKGGCVDITPDTTAAAERALAAVEPAGRSSHAAGLRAALALNPDLVLVLTDADDLPAGVFRGLLTQAPKPARLYVGRVPDAGPPAVLVME